MKWIDKATNKYVEYRHKEALMIIKNFSPWISYSTFLPSPSINSTGQIQLKTSLVEAGRLARSAPPARFGVEEGPN